MCMSMCKCAHVHYGPPTFEWPAVSSRSAASVMPYGFSFGTLSAAEEEDTAPVTFNQLTCSSSSNLPFCLPQLLTWHPLYTPSCSQATSSCTARLNFESNPARCRGMLLSLHHSNMRHPVMDMTVACRDKWTNSVVSFVSISSFIWSNLYWLPGSGQEMARWNRCVMCKYLCI